MDDIDDKSLAYLLINTHKVTGVAILILMVLRLFWMLINIKPELPNASIWERMLEHAVHALFYVLLIVMPLSGWMMSSAAEKPPHIFNWSFSLPVQHSKPVIMFFKSIHNTLAIIIIVMICLHVLAALYHYFIKKDDVLQRMSP